MTRVSPIDPDPVHSPVAVARGITEPMRKRRHVFETEILRLALFTGLPGAAATLGLVWFGDYSDKVRWTFSVLVVVAWLGFAFAVRERVVRPLQTLSNLLAALREGDYSIRARGGRNA